MRPSANKAKLKDINGRLSTLQTDFGQKLTKGTKDAALVVNGKAGVAGLGAGEMAAAEKAAAPTLMKCEQSLGTIALVDGDHATLIRSRETAADQFRNEMLISAT